MLERGVHTVHLGCGCRIFGVLVAATAEDHHLRLHLPVVPGPGLLCVAVAGVLLKLGVDAGGHLVLLPATRTLLPLALQQVGHHTDAEALFVATVDAVFARGRHPAALLARLAPLQALLVDPLNGPAEKDAT